LRRLALICHAATKATRIAAFPTDEDLEARALDGVALPQRFAKPAQCWTSPARRAVHTAEALGLAATVEPLLRDCDFGRWAGHPIADVGRDEPEAMAQWLADPAAAPHGGESIVALIARAGIWLANLDARSGWVVAVTHQAVIRATVIHALDVAPAAFWRIDVPPLAVIELTDNGRRWSLAFPGMF
jgi:broad specificity phosphatase PhoE